MYIGEKKKRGIIIITISEMILVFITHLKIGNSWKLCVTKGHIYVVLGMLLK